MELASAEPDFDGAAAADSGTAPRSKERPKTASPPGETPPDSLVELVDRYDARAFEIGRSRARIRLSGAVVSELPPGSPQLFLDSLTGQEIVGDTLAEQAAREDCVRLLTAHRR